MSQLLTLTLKDESRIIKHELEVLHTVCTGLNYDRTLLQTPPAPKKKLKMASTSKSRILCCPKARSSHIIVDFCLFPLSKLQVLVHLVKFRFQSRHAGHSAA